MSDDTVFFLFLKLKIGSLCTSTLGDFHIN